MVHWRARLTGGHPGDAFSELQREKRGVMVHIIAANQWTLKQKSVFKPVLLWNIEKTETEWVKGGKATARGSVQGEEHGLKVELCELAAGKKPL